MAAFPISRRERSSSSRACNTSCSPRPAAWFLAACCRSWRAESVVHVVAPELTAADRRELADLVRELSVVQGRVTLSSGKIADYYVDLRRATLHHRASPLIGRLLR